MGGTLVFQEFHYQVRGRGHVTDGTPVQDRTKFLSRAGVQVLCLADGAGSAARSDIGAQIVVDTGCRLFADDFESLTSDDDAARVKRRITDVLVGRLEETAWRQECEVSDLASTFMVVAASGDRFVGAHIGDGVVGYMKGGELKVISAPDNNEFANQTIFVTSKGAVESMRLFRGSTDQVAGFVLMSDGTGDSLYNSRTGQLANACAKLIIAVGAAPARQSKNSKYKKSWRKLIDTKVRHATKDDCSIGILGRDLD